MTDPFPRDDLPLGYETKALFPRGQRPPGLPLAPIPSPGRAPISSVAGDAAAVAALREVAGELTAARAEGRLVLRLPLGQIDAAYLLRDRIAAEEEDLQSLIDSLRAHGQRNAIEVVQIAPDRYGLISGWRRLLALRRLLEETGDTARFGTVLALLRRPESAADAYVAMVEENEIRAGLSYWERARIAARAVEAGVFGAEKIALQRLYAAASRAKRSKIGSFLSLYHALEGALRFPAALPERLGLALARACEDDPQAPARLRAALAASPPDSAEAERALLTACLEPAAPPAPPAEPSPPGAPRQQAPQTVSDRPLSATRPPRPAPAAVELRPGLYLADTGAGLLLSGPALDARLRDRLAGWLRADGPETDGPRLGGAAQKG